MQMWRDPLDELIADLDRSVPTSPAPDFDMPTMTTVSGGSGCSLPADPAKKAQLADDPHVKRVEAYHERWAARLAKRRTQASRKASGGSAAASPR